MIEKQLLIELFLVSWVTEFTKGFYHFSELASRIGQSANGTRQFCQITRTAYDQTSHPSRAESHERTSTEMFFDL